MTIFTKLISGAVFSVMGFSSLASQAKVIPSCYTYAEIEEYTQASPLRTLVIMVDQTARFDTALKKTVHEKVQNYLGAGDRVQIVSFSANAKGRYTKITFDGKFDHPLPQDERNDLNRQKLSKFDRCMHDQPMAINKVHHALKNAFHDEAQEYPKTELVGSLLSVGSDVLANIQAPEKSLLIVSDMFENSDITSFYRAGALRKIDADREFQKVLESGVTGDLKGANVNIIGAAFVDGGSGYSSQAALMQLEKFWRKVINENNGNVKGFGKPQLFGDL